MLTQRLKAMLGAARTFKAKEGIGRILFKGVGGAPTVTQQGNWFLTAACAIVMTAPVLLLSALLQRHLLRGTSLAGAIR